MVLKLENELPEELLFQILIRLPVLSLLRFRSVSKSWYSLITSLDFINSHLQFQDCNNDNVLFKKVLCYPREEIYSLHADNREFHEIQTFDLPFMNLRMVGCVNGLICLTTTCSRTIMLWNPSIRKCFFLPEIVMDQPVYGSMCFAFGYDVLSNDFKVMLLVYGNIFRYAQASVNIFSLATNSWKTLPDCVRWRRMSSPCNVGGCLYHLAVTPILNSIYYSIEVVSFDLSTEVFMEIDIPVDFTPGQTMYYAKLSKFRESLGLLTESRDSMRYDMWVMREDGAAKSWMKLFLVYLGEGISQGVVGCTKNGVMLVVGDGDLIVSSSTLEGPHVVQYAPPRFRSFDVMYCQVESFKESLVLLNEGVSLEWMKERLTLLNEARFFLSL